MYKVDGISAFNQFISLIMGIVSQAVTNPTIQYITIFISADIIFSKVKFNFPFLGGIVARLINATIIVVHAMTVASAVMYVYRG